VSCRLVNLCLIGENWRPEKLHECHVPENVSFLGCPSRDPGDGTSVVRRGAVLQYGRLWF
jgi:hypothetical protein